jgi:hypothetical protein
MRTRGGRTGSLIVTAVAVLTLTAGCSGDAPEPSEIDNGNDGGNSESRTPPESDPPTPPEPAEPDLDDHEQELYDATVTFYDTVTTAFQTLDKAPLEKLVVPGSNAAAGYVEQIDWMKDQNNRYKKLPEYTISGFGVEEDADESIETVEFTLSNDGTSIVDAGGKPVHESKPVTDKASITFKQQGETWLVVTQDIE